MVSAQDGVFLELGRELSFPGPHRAPIPFCHPEVMVLPLCSCCLPSWRAHPSMVQSRTIGLAIQDAHQATLSVELLLLWLQWGDFGWHQDSGLQFAIWCGGWEKGGHRCLSLPGSWGPGAAMSRGVREEVTRQFAVSLAAVGPSKHVPSSHLPPGSGKAVGWPRAVLSPGVERAPMRAPGSHYSRKEGALFFLAPRMLLPLWLWKSVLWPALFVR